MGSKTKNFGTKYLQSTLGADYISAQGLVTISDVLLDFAEDFLGYDTEEGLEWVETNIHEFI